ncbi:unnamed protein product [Rotaria socialis]|uniref:Uncharacterized protein n=1 Tax=Rotaria socialis TaxID=392032 RepID=A0A821HKS5_9BILA|nr:unnamed protein product [Rotaria socialis]
MTQSWQLINLQFKTQAEAIVDIYTTISEILPPVVQSLQTINQVIEEINRNVIDENERQRKQIIFTTIKETIFSLNSRLCLLTDHQQKLKTLMDKKKFIAESTHIADIDILLSIHIPQLLILTGVGSKIRNLPKTTSYH